MRISMILLALVLLSGEAAWAMEIGGAHTDQGFACADCHGTDEPEAAPAIAACLECHGSYEEIAEATKPAEPDPEDPESYANPHDSHMGQLDCTSCHKTHSPSELVCAECHSFDLEPK